MTESPLQLSFSCTSSTAAAPSGQTSFRTSLRKATPCSRPTYEASGESTTIVRDGEAADYQLQNLDDMLFDVAAAIIYLSTRTEAEADAIGVVGASVGGNLTEVMPS